MYTNRSLNSVTQQMVAIKSIDLGSNTATGIIRDGSPITIAIDMYAGAIQVVPAVGEQWIAEKGIGGWKLLSQLPFNDPGALIPTTEGQHKIGSGKGPIELSATAINAYAPITLQSKTTATRPDPAVAGVGAMVYDATLLKPIWSNGTNWHDATGTTV